MPDCDACGLSLNGSVNFCPRCGQPQNDAAKKRLDDYVKRQAALDAETGAQSTDGTALADRASYVVGYVAVVAGFAVASDIRTVLFVLGGVAVLPPVGRLLGRVTGRSVGIRLRAVVFAVLIAAGVAAGQFL
ncbi:hypothetical protein ACFQL1_03480 [Halomicroarcula sp. GCM10025709]|uniref:hypothetical protein n=1 Tax=Haloarcula TaxID=2237 RepID=UPI0024C399E2|nr:hypothetical protein [Halomicroarcula sp. YJ-61-S]